MKKKDAQKSPGNKDKTPKKTKVAAPPPVEVQQPPPPPPSSAPPPVSIPIPVTVEPVVSKSAIPVDSLSVQEEKFSSARETPLTARTAEEQDVEQYAEQIEIMSPEDLFGLLHQKSFIELLEIVSTRILPKLLECTLNGASFYRNLMKIFRFILQSDLDPHLIISFCQTMQIPSTQLKHLRSILEHATIRKEVQNNSVCIDQSILSLILAMVCSCTLR